MQIFSQALSRIGQYRSDPNLIHRNEAILGSPRGRVCVTNHANHASDSYLQSESYAEVPGKSLVLIGSNPAEERSVVPEK